jgi:hypothetical protein
MTTQTNLHQDLRGFTGTDHYYKHWLSHLVFTDGVKFLAENGGCFWLIDAIASHLKNPAWIAKKYGEKFASLHFWFLTPNGKGGAVLTARADSSDPVVIRQRIEYTDFPFDDGKPFQLYVGAQETGRGMVYVAMLPSEY